MPKYLSALALLTVSTLAIVAIPETPSPFEQPSGEPQAIGFCEGLAPLCLTGKAVCMCDQINRCFWACVE